MISRDMWNNAQRLIGEDALAAYRAANFLPNGRLRKRHRQYSLPARVDVMVAALSLNDAEQVSALIRNWDILPQWDKSAQ